MLPQKMSSLDFHLLLRCSLHHELLATVQQRSDPSPSGDAEGRVGLSVQQVISQTGCQPR